VKIFTPIKRLFARSCQESPSLDEVEIAILGLKAKMLRKMYLPVPHEVSLFVPRLELTNKVTEGGKTTETSVILNSLTIVSAPRSLVPGHPQGVPLKQLKI
jgi:hypothetical protein